MVGIAALGLMLVAPAAPVPAQPPVPAAKADRWRAQEFARIVYQTGEQVAHRMQRLDRGYGLGRFAMRHLRR